MGEFIQLQAGTLSHIHTFTVCLNRSSPVWTIMGCTGGKKWKLSDLSSTMFLPITYVKLLAVSAIKRRPGRTSGVLAYYNLDTKRNIRQA